jgi:hypothetical protein
MCCTCGNRSSFPRCCTSAGTLAPCLAAWCPVGAMLPCCIRLCADPFEVHHKPLNHLKHSSIPYTSVMRCEQWLYCAILARLGLQSVDAQLREQVPYCDLRGQHATFNCMSHLTWRVPSPSACATGFAFGCICGAATPRKLAQRTGIREYPINAGGILPASYMLRYISSSRRTSPRRACVSASASGPRKP